MCVYVCVCSTLKLGKNGNQLIKAGVEKEEIQLKHDSWNIKKLMQPTGLTLWFLFLGREIRQKKTCELCMCMCAAAMVAIYQSGQSKSNWFVVENQ